MFVADGGESVRKLLEPSSEPFRPEMNRYENAREIKVLETWQIQTKRTELCKQYLDRWNVEGLDAILCTIQTSAFRRAYSDHTAGPTTPYSSVKHGDFEYFGYTGIFNILDYSAVSFPCGVTVRQDVDIYANDDTQPLSESCASVRDACKLSMSSVTYSAGV
jgi:amidase